MRLWTAAALLWGCVAPGFAQTSSAPWIATAEPITIVSANDGWAHMRLTPDAHLTRDVDNLTPDSITVVHLGPDHPPLVTTVYGTVPNSILGPPHIAMTGDGHYGFVPSVGPIPFGDDEVQEEGPFISVVDLSAPEVTVVERVAVPVAVNMLDMHPDGEHLIAATQGGFRVYRMENGRLVLVTDNPIDFQVLGAFDISPVGDRIVAIGRRAPDGQPGVHILRYTDGVIEHASDVQVRDGLPGFSNMGMMRFSPDGSRVLIPNGAGFGTKGTLDPVLIVDMTLTPPVATEVVPQVCDGVESMAYHPDGHFAVLSCLEEIPAGAGVPSAPVAYSRLAVIDLTSRPARKLYDVDVRGVPEGIEFTPDGRHLFVQLTSAHQLTVFNVDGFLLQRHPFSIRVGHAPASMALGRRYAAP